MNDELTYEALIKPIPPRLNLANAQAQESSKTCEFCTLIVPDRRKAQGGLIQTGYERVDLYPDFPELKASARAGCRLCGLMRKTIRKHWAVRPMEEWGVGPISERDGCWDELLDAPWDRKVKIHKVTFDLKVADHNFAMSPVSTATESLEDGMVTTLAMEFGPATLFISPQTDFQCGEISQALSFKVFESQDLEVKNGDSRRRLPGPLTLSAPNLQMISKWIDECKSSHPTCRLDESAWLPTRLLDVGSLDGTQLPRLVETVKEDVEPPYAALSHMWGDPNQGHAPPVRTLKANYTKMESGIPWQIMSKNFIDAVIATRRLGLRYIWIDSLCIIQDSPEDWQKEAATMYKVYKFAEITLVATSAISANDGFLERYLSTIPAVMIDYSLDTTMKATREMVLCAPDASGAGNWLSDIEGSPWNKRGWTLQERSVSTRMLHFCKTKLYFECRGCVRSEENEPFGRYMPRVFEMWPRGEDKKPKDLLPQYPDIKSQRRGDLHKRWIRAVTEYSRRRLTKETDKLLAIQVLAAEISTTVDDIYIPYAGMWERQLHRDLLWQVLGRPRSLQDKYLAPSWSWVSVDAGIKWEAGSIPITPSNSSLPSNSFSVLNIASHVKTSQPSRHFLKVRAFLKPIAFPLECDIGDRWVNVSRFTFPFDLFISNRSLHTKEHETSISTLSIAERQMAIDEGRFIKFAEGRLDLDDTDDLTKSQRPIFYLHVDHAQPSGLILEPVTDTKRLWKRVGVATVFASNKDLFIDPCFAESEQQAEVTII